MGNDNLVFACSGFKCAVIFQLYGTFLDLLLTLMITYPGFNSEFNLGN